MRKFVFLGGLLILGIILVGGCALKFGKPAPDTDSKKVSLSEEPVAEPETVDECTTNADCDDGDASTKDKCAGVPRKCVYYEITKEEPTPTPTPAPTPAPGPTKCNSMDCLIELARACKKGELLYSYSVPNPLFIGVTSSGKTYYKINGKDSLGLCKFTFQSRGGNQTLSEEGRQTLVERGMTNQEIDDQIKAMNDATNSEDVLKIVNDCIGTGANIATYLDNSRQGTSSGGCKIEMGMEGSKVACTYEPGITCTYETRSVQKRILANTSTKIESFQCPDEAESLSVREDGTACSENQKDLGTIKGITVNEKPVQCCILK